MPAFPELDAEVAALTDFEKRFAGLDLKNEPVGIGVDRDLVINKIRGRLLEITSIRPWEKNPDVYSSAISRAAFVLISRTFAPPEQRLKSVIAREKQVPAVFTAARQNLNNPPPVYVDVALEQIPGLVSFFQKMRRVNDGDAALLPGTVEVFPQVAPRPRIKARAWLIEDQEFRAVNHPFC